MADYYDLLGVAPDATKEEIRRAYRAELDALDPDSQRDRERRAELGRAWNILSDPVQRERYDRQRDDGTIDLVEEGDDIEVVDDRPAARAAGARPRPEPTVQLPPGMHLAETRPRMLALVFDVSVLAVLYFVAFSLILPAVIEAQHPEEADRLDEITTQIDDLDEQRSEIQDDADRAEENDNDQRARELRRQVTGRDGLDDQIEQLEEEARDLQGEFAGSIYLVATGVLLLGLAYLVPMTVLNGGQSLGKRLRGVWLVRQDGSRVTWGGALAHYGVPLALAVLLWQLGMFAVLLGLGCVLFSLWDRNRQGVHDKLARTLVVDRPPAA